MHKENIRKHWENIHIIVKILGKQRKFRVNQQNWGVLENIGIATPKVPLIIARHQVSQSVGKVRPPVNINGKKQMAASDSRSAINKNGSNSPTPNRAATKLVPQKKPKIPI